jgi:hypothetical protein
LRNDEREKAFEAHLGFLLVLLLGVFGSASRVFGRASIFFGGASLLLSGSLVLFIVGTSVLEFGTMDLLVEENGVVAFVALALALDSSTQVNDAWIVTTNGSARIDGLLVEVLELEENLSKVVVRFVADDSRDIGGVTLL